MARSHSSSCLKRIRTDDSILAMVIFVHLCVASIKQSTSRVINIAAVKKNSMNELTNSHQVIVLPLKLSEKYEAKSMDMFETFCFD